MHRYKPEKKKQKALIFVGFCFTLTVILIVVSALVTEFNWILQAGAIIMVTLGIQIGVRFVLSDYIYVLDGRNFIVIKANGNKQIQVCNVDLATAIDVAGDISSDEVKKKYGKIGLNYNMSQNFMAEKYSFYIFEFNGKTSAIKFEPDTAMFSEMKNRISLYKGQKTENDT